MKGIKGKDSNIVIEGSGLIIDKKYCWLSCSPDGVVKIDSDRGMLEIKCPFTGNIKFS